MTEKQRRTAIRSFLQASVSGGAPTAADYAAMGLPEQGERVLRSAVRAVRKTAGTSATGWNGDRARAVAEELVDDVLAAAREAWEAPSESPTELAERVPRGGYPQ